MQQILTENHLPEGRLEQSRWSMPGELYFLREDFIRQHWPLTGLDDSRLEEIIGLARKISGSPDLKLLAWHLHLFYINDLTFFRFPDYISLLGKDTGLFYILLVLGTAPLLSARAARERYPERYALEGLNRIGRTVIMREQAHPGEFGLRGRSLPFFEHYLHSPCFRIGRLDFILGESGEAQPELFLKDGQVLALCRDGWELDSEGLRADPEGTVFRRTRLICSGQTLTGTPIDSASGKALPEEITLDLNQWRRICPPGARIANIHIPGGASFTPENVLSSLQEAAGFLKDYCSDRPVQAFFSSSWLFSPDWAELLPASNLAGVIRAMPCYPGLWSPLCGLIFVFGREDRDWASYPRDNSLRRAILKLLEGRGFLRCGGIFAVPELLLR